MKIRLYAHPLAPVAAQEFEADSLALWLLGHYGPVPQVTVQIFAGEPSADTDISHDAAAILRSDAPEYVILQSPGDPITILTSIAISLAMSFVMQLLFPPPEMPGNVNRTQESPNNSLAARENQVRLLQRVEDIFGTVKSIPSLLMPTYNKYINHQRVEYGYYCVGRGYYALNELRDGDTLIAGISGASAAVYDPFTSPNSGHAPVLQIGDAIIDRVLTVSRAVEVDGITLSAFNQVQLPAAFDWAFTPSAGGDILTQATKQPNINAVAAVGDSIAVSMASYALEEGEWHDAAHNVVAQEGADHFHVTSTTYYNYSGAYTIASVGDGTVTLTSVTSGPNVPTGVNVSLYERSEYTDWVTLPNVDRTEVWVNLIAASGIYKDSGGGKTAATVAYTLQIEQLDALTLAPTGVVENVSSALTGQEGSERAETLEHATSWTGPARARMHRTSPFDYGFAGTVIDETKWADLYSVTPITKAEFGNKTTVHTITKATPRATAARARQLNCLASRKLPIFNGSGFSGAFDAEGRHISGTIAATSKIVDILAAVSIDPKIGRRDLATEVDMAQIWAVQQQIDAWNAACGQFNFTFDSDTTSFEETITTVANAASCIAYRQNGKIRLAFDHAQPVSAALFTHRNKKPASETITRKFSTDAEYDGVEFVYQDPDSQQPETIRLPLDGSATKYKKHEIPGIRNFAQAWYRANREYQKLIGQRVSIETEATTDARLLLPNSRIDIVDNTRFKSFDGEVVGQSGLELTLSRDVEFAASVPHSIILMRRDGSLQSLACSAGSAPNRVVLASLPSESIVIVGGQDGIRTIFSFAADSARAAQAWLVQEIDISDSQYCTVRAINYSTDYYTADYAAIPAKASVIN